MRALWLALLLPACSRPRAAPAPAADPPAPATGYVVIAREAWFRAAAAADAPGAHVPASDPSACALYSAPHVWVMRKVADEGDWITVENLQTSEAAPHCYAHSDVLDGYRLRLHVRRADVLPVTTREVDVDYADGTGFTLSAGVALAKAGERFRVDVDGNHPVLALPADAVGDSYPAPSARLQTEAELERRADVELPFAQLLVGGAPIELAATWDASIVLAPLPDDPQRQRATVRMACSEYRGVVPLQGTLAEVGVGCGIGAEGVTDLPGLPAGTPLTWPDGRAAGETVDEVRIRWETDPRGDRRCFHLPLHPRLDWPDAEHPDPSWLFTLCAAAGAWIPGYGG